MNDIDEKQEIYRKYSLNFAFLYENSPEFIRAAKRFLIHKHRISTISEFCQKQGFEYNNNDSDLKKNTSIVKQILKLFPELYINTVEDLVCDLRTSTVVTKHDKEYFYYFFNHKLYQLKIIEIDSFLEYQLKESYKIDFNSFKRFLMILIREYGNTMSVKATIQEWIELFPQKQANEKADKKLIWNGHPQELINGFNYLMTTNCKKKIPYCEIENLDNFIFSNFNFGNFRIPTFEPNNYRFTWNADIHDFTYLLKLLKKDHIRSTNIDIKDFILKVIPESKLTSIMSYLNGTRDKQKFDINTSKFCY